jgi:hypothetical protein
MEMQADDFCEWKSLTNFVNQRFTSRPDDSRPSHSATNLVPSGRGKVKSECDVQTAESTLYISSSLYRSVT